MGESEDPRAIVRRGYDVVSQAYRGDAFEYAGSVYQHLLERAFAGIADGLEILDLGCGNGIPVSQVLAQSHHVTGCDISKVQLQRAQTLIPSARFVLGDIAHLCFRPESFDGVVAFYSIIHVPVEEHARVIRDIARCLRPGGLLLATVGHTAWTGTEDDWQGVPGGRMYWSHAGRASYLQWLADAGLVVEWDEFVPEGKGGHTVVFGRRPGDAVHHGDRDVRDEM